MYRINFDLVHNSKDTAVAPSGNKKQIDQSRSHWQCYRRDICKLS